MAAEASAADRAMFANLMPSELFYQTPAYKVGMKINGLHVCDAKSLYDTIVAENPNFTDKRSLVNIRSIQQTVRPKQLCWVPKGLMGADAKLDPQLMSELSSWLQNPVIQITEGHGVTSSKKKQLTKLTCLRVIHELVSAWHVTVRRYKRSLEFRSFAPAGKRQAAFV